MAQDVLEKEKKRQTHTNLRYCDKICQSCNFWMNRKQEIICMQQLNLGDSDDKFVLVLGIWSFYWILDSTSSKESMDPFHSCRIISFISRDKKREQRRWKNFPNQFQHISLVFKFIGTFLILMSLVTGEVKQFKVHWIKEMGEGERLRLQIGFSLSPLAKWKRNKYTILKCTNILNHIYKDTMPWTGVATIGPC